MSTKTSQLVKQKNPKLRFDIFNGIWEEKKLSNITSIYDGTHQTPNYVKEGIPFYSVEHLTSNDFSNTKFITNDVFEKENKKVKIEKGDILMTRIGDIGTARIIDWDVRASFYVSLALIKKSMKVDSSFLSQYINSVNFQKELWKRTIHVAFPKKINLGEIGACRLFIPKLNEQQKISDFLNEIDKLMGNFRKEKETFELYKKGMMSKIFSQEIRFRDNNGNEFPKWEEKKLGEVSDFLDGKRVPLNDADRQKKQGKYPYYGASGIIDYIDDYIFDGEYILLGEDGANIVTRSTRLVFLATGKFWVNNHAHVLKAHGSNYFLSEYLETLRYEKYNTGTAQPKLNSEICKKIRVSIPVLDEQQKIAEFLISIDKVIESKQQQISQAEEWKKGLMQGLFV